MNLRGKTFQVGPYLQHRVIPLKREAIIAALHVFAIVLILSVSLALRMTQLNALGYNSDEAVYAGQGASIAQVPILRDIFPVFRAHPLLFQFTLSLVFQFEFSDWLGRMTAVVIGVVTIFLTYRLAGSLYGKTAGLIAALFMALMPYHVVASRQAMLDSPQMFFSTLALYMLVRFSKSGRRVDLLACAAGMGLSFLAKEISIILVGAIYAFLAISPEIRVRISDIFLSLVTMIGVMLPFPLSVSLAGGGGGEKTQQYLVWQLFRRPNHTWDFYPTTVPPAIGLLVILLAVFGLWMLRHRTDWREKLLMLWIIVPIIFFQLWPTKGFLYLMPIAPAFAVLAARTLTRWPTKDIEGKTWRIPRYVPGVILTAITTVSLLSMSFNIVTSSGSASFLAGSGGVPGGKEAGLWVKQNVPIGATLMTIGPSMANIIQFYGHRQAYGLSVSPNPLYRNPSYDPIDNPDFQIRTGEIQYAVWDAFSAERSSFFSDRLMGYVQKYNGRVVHIETITITNSAGHEVESPIIVIYAVHQ